MNCSNCHAALPPAAATCPGCGATMLAPPAQGEFPQDGSVLSHGLAGFWLRVAALLLDNALIGVISTPLTFAAFGIYFAISPDFFSADRTADQGFPIGLYIASGITALIVVIAEVVYFALTEGGKKQGTFGKRIVGIMVCTDDGKRMQTGRAWGRGILKGLCLLPYIGAIPMVISMITVGASDKNRALHDMAVKTLVVRRKPANIFPTMPYIPPQPQTVEQALT